MEYENFPWLRNCYKCNRLINDVRMIYEERYRGKRPVPTYATDTDGNYVCLDCSPENIFFNLDYDFFNEEKTDKLLI